MSRESHAGLTYCWFDTEFTGLDLEQASLLQVALVVTGLDLKPLKPASVEGLPAGILRENGLSMYLKPPVGWEPSEFIRENMPAVVQRCEASSYSVQDADRALALYLDQLLGPCPEDIKARPVMAGNSIHTDWFLARRDLPEFHSRLHYRLMDVSSLKAEWRAHSGEDSESFAKEEPEVVRAAYPHAELSGEALHDAYYDAQASIAELSWFRSRPMWGSR